MLQPMIGGSIFTTMQGSTTPPAPAIEAIERPGVHGATFRDLGQKEVASTVVTTVTVLDDAAASTEVNAQRAMIGTVVGVIDSHERASLCLVVNCEPQIRAVLKPTSNPAHTRLIETRWTLRELYIEI